jgi:hypothetical protein
MQALSIGDSTSADEPKTLPLEDYGSFDAAVAIASQVSYCARAGRNAGTDRAGLGAPRRRKYGCHSTADLAARSILHSSEDSV